MQVEIMKRLRDHPNILTLRAVAFVGPQGAEQEAFLLLDLCQESLVDHIRAAGAPLPDSTVLTIFHSVCKAVSLMHHQSPPLSHRYPNFTARYCVIANQSLMKLRRHNFKTLQKCAWNEIVYVYGHLCLHLREAVQLFQVI